MVWNVDGPNETTQATRLPVGSISDLKEDVDVKKENLRKIQQVVEQLDADIKYCHTKENSLQNSRHDLMNQLAKTEAQIEKTTSERIALADTRSAIAQAMYNLDPQEKSEIKEDLDLPASFDRRY